MKKFFELFGIIIFAVFSLSYVAVEGQADTTAAGLVQIYRMYNPNSGEHFYTQSSDERNNLYRTGWNYEGIAWDAQSSSNLPVYRLYNPNAGDHFYTTSVKERDHLVSVGWNYEGVSFYAGGTVNVYRAYNPNAAAGAHNFTTSSYEQSNLVSNGWHDENISWQVAAKPSTAELNAAQAQVNAIQLTPAQKYAGKKIIALTFDDGPSPATTPTLLQTLQQYQATVTFFVIGQNAQANPDIVKQEAALGNEIASHTWDHPDLTTTSSGQVTTEIENTATLIQQLTGQNNPVFRPPYGSVNSSVLSDTSRAAVNWNNDTRDWATLNANATIQAALTNPHDGEIILMHDIHASTVAAVPQIIQGLRDQGFTLVSVNDLIAARYGGISAGNVYYGK